MKHYKRGFTLIELMLVVAIMAMMGTISVGAYRSMRRGMEERGVMQNVNQFIRNACQRANIDRCPTAVCFWNETRRVDNDDGDTLLVVGRAVAIRRAGRVSAKSGKVIVDEFGDLKFFRNTDATGKNEEYSSSSQNSKMAIYKMNGTTIVKDTGSPIPVKASQTVTRLLSDGDNSNNDNITIVAYGYEVDGGWQVGDAYGFEFATLTLPNNYIFGTSYSPPSSINSSQAIQEVSRRLVFTPGDEGSGQSIDISAIRPGSKGTPEVKKVDTARITDED